MKVKKGLKQHEWNEPEYINKKVKEIKLPKPKISTLHIEPHQKSKKMYIARNIKWLSKKLNKSGTEMAQILDVNYQTYGSWLDSRGIKPSIDMLIKLSELANVTLSEFVKEDLAKAKTKKTSQKDLFYSNYISAAPKIKKAVETLLELK